MYWASLLTRLTYSSSASRFPCRKVGQRVSHPQSTFLARGGASQMSKVVRFVSFCNGSTGPWLYCSASFKWASFEFVILRFKLTLKVFRFPIWIYFIPSMCSCLWSCLSVCPAICLHIWGGGQNFLGQHNGQERLDFAMAGRREPPRSRLARANV